jgi:hypothetical protein
MIGCGNSSKICPKTKILELSEQMFDDGHHNIVNVDIAPTIVEAMKVYHDKKEKFMEWTQMDATSLTYESESFDLVIDKGTIDAVICGDDLQIPLDIMKEMCRVTKEEGNVMLITNSGAPGRKMLFEAAVDKTKFETSYTKVCLSDKSDLINIMRSNLRDKPLNMILKDKDTLLRSMIEYKISCAIRDRRNKKPAILEKLVYDNCKVNYRVQNLHLEKGAEAFGGDAVDKGKFEDAKPTDASKPVEDVTPTDASKPVEDVTPTDASKPVEDVTPTDASKPVEDVTPTDDVKVVDPTKTQHTLAEGGVESGVAEKNYVKVNDTGYAPIRQNHCYVFLTRRLGPKGAQEEKVEVKSEAEAPVEVKSEAEAPVEVKSEAEAPVEVKSEAEAPVEAEAVNEEECPPLVGVGEDVPKEE